MVRSPCVSICALDEHDICTGCFRSGQEISQWGTYDDEHKRQVLKACAQREQASGKVLMPVRR